MSIQDKLFSFQDKQYKEFQKSLIPNILDETIIGVRVPLIRKYAKELIKENNYFNFINSTPHKYYDENMLHIAILSEINDYKFVMNNLNEFLGYIDNWAVCDYPLPKIFVKHKGELINEIDKWLLSKHPYTVRYAIGVLMRIFIREENCVPYVERVINVVSHDYYVNMMKAWFMQVLYVYHKDVAAKYITEIVLGSDVYKKTIRKIRESKISQKKLKT